MGSPSDPKRAASWTGCHWPLMQKALANERLKADNWMKEVSAGVEPNGRCKRDQTRILTLPSRVWPIMAPSKGAQKSRIRAVSTDYRHSETLAVALNNFGYDDQSVKLSVGDRIFKVR